jgi:hypothetical protein
MPITRTQFVALLEQHPQGVGDEILSQNFGEGYANMTDMSMALVSFPLQ